MTEHIIVIGGGGTGAALAYDLVTRGMRVTLLEKGEILSGATGRHHGLLHSGARYAVHDPDAAKECYQENQILRRIAPFAIEQNDGLFVATDEEDREYALRFLEACSLCGIPTQQLSAEEALALEPALTPNLLFAVRVPDATFDPFRLPLSFLAAALEEGVTLRRFTEVTGFLEDGERIIGVKARDLRDGQERELGADLVINAAGAWAGEVASRAGVDIPLQPGPGVMVALNGRLTDMVINHLKPAGEGDIIVPQRRLTIVGTSLWLAEHPDDVETPPDHVERMIELSSALVPGVGEAKIRAAWSASRPLLDDPRWHDDPQQMTRSFRCFDHGELDGRPGLVSLIGGKATTLRAMAEIGADLACNLLGRQEAKSHTEERRLPPHRRFFHQLGDAGGAA